MRPGPGVWVTSNIELVSPIAEGAMGSVWVAHHHVLRTRVAVKFVSDKLGEDTAEALARFEREVYTAAQIKSAHVVQTFDSGATPEGVPYMVMELLEGESLGDRLRRARHISLEEAAAVLIQVSRALTKAHMLGIVHRDIKPDNIFLCSGEAGIFCKVLDFGIAKQTRLPSMGGLTTEGTMVGTPEYLSPEQVLEGARVDYRADLWALAIVIYSALTGTLPYSGKTVGQLCLALASAKHRPPSELQSSLPASIDGWFRRALHRSPDQRYGSAQQMALGFLRHMPDAAAAGVDLGVGTSLNVDGDTERNFGTTTDTHPRVTRPRARWIGAVALVLAVGVGAMAVVNARATEHTALTLNASLGVAAKTVAEDAETAIDEPTEAPIDLDAEETDEQGTPMVKSAPAAKPPRSPGRTFVGRKSAAKEPEVEEPAAPAPPPPPPAPPNASKVRGKAELGF